MWLLLTVLLLLLIATLTVAMQLDDNPSMQRLDQHGADSDSEMQLDDALKMAVRYMLQNDLAKAEMLLSETLIRHRNNADCWMLYGSVFYRQGQYSRAAHAFRQVLKLQPDNAAGYNNLAESLIKAKKFDEAIAALTIAAKLAPDHGEILLNAANLFALRQQNEQAMNFLQQALAKGVAPERVARHRALVTLLERTALPPTLPDNVNNSSTPAGK